MAIIMTPPGLLSFPKLFAAEPRFPGGDPVYSLAMLFSPEAQKSNEYKALVDAIKQAAADKWGDNIPGGLRLPLRDASEKSYKGYDAGRTFFNAWSKQAPGIVGPDKAQIRTESQVFPGQIARCTVSPFAYDQSGNRGVSLGLQNVQIIRFDMERLDSRVAAEDAFGDATGADTAGYAAGAAAPAQADNPFAGL